MDVDITIADQNSIYLYPMERCILIKDYSNISAEFCGHSIYDIIEWHLIERYVPKFSKNYDDYEYPLSWCTNWDISEWGIIFVQIGNLPIAGAIVAVHTDGLDMSEERDDLAVLLDIRVLPEYRRKGIGSQLFRFVEEWSKRRGLTELKIETQNNNVAAVKFYRKMGCIISEINRNVYLKIPEEIQLIFRKQI